MSAPAAGRIRLSDPSELIAAVPHLLGFHPHNSVVLLALHGRNLGLTLRADLVGDDQARLLAEQLLLPIARQRPTGVAVVVLGGDPTSDGDPPHQALVEALEDVLTGGGLPVVHASWAAETAHGAPWRCYGDPLCAGTVPDPATSPLAVATVAAGVVTFGSREEMAELVAAEDPAALQRRAVLLDAADADHPMSARLVAQRLVRLGELHRTASSPRSPLRCVTIGSGTLAWLGAWDPARPPPSGSGWLLFGQPPRRSGPNPRHFWHSPRTFAGTAR
jgi:hypothetical protein